MSRVRRCSWEIGLRCHEQATHRVKATYLGQPVDRDVPFCGPHAARAGELIVGHPGWAIVETVPLEVEEEVPA
jgi:hypothetical protein